MTVLQGVVRATLAAVLGAWLLPAAVTAAAAQEAVPNPTIDASCSLDITLVLDASGSVEDFGAVEQVRAAARDFLDGLSGTGSTARITQFGTSSAQLAAGRVVDERALAPGGPFDAALDRYYDPRPAKPADVDYYRYRGGDPSDPASFALLPTGGTQFTNWDAALEQTVEPVADLVVFVTDGEPTAFDLDAPDDPFDAGPPPDVALDTASGLAADVTMDRAVEAANRVKATSRLLAVGVGDNAAAPTTQARLVAVSGDEVVVDPAPGTARDVNDVDVVIVSRFDDLATYLGDLVFGLCAPAVVVQTLSDGPDQADYRPDAGRRVTTTPSVPGGFSWVLPADASGPTARAVTDRDGRAVFQWRPTGRSASDVRVRVPVDATYVAGRPSKPDYVCTLRNSSGATRTLAGNVDDEEVLEFQIERLGRERATCALYRTYSPRSAMTLDVSTPAGGVRGDLDPPAQVTSTLVVGNPGDVPLSELAVEGECATISPDLSRPGNVGDIAPRNGLLDPGEEWTTSCIREVRAVGAPAGGETLRWATTVAGRDPQGRAISATARSRITAFRPGVAVSGTVVERDSGLAVGQTVAVWTVQNTGNTPLADVLVRGTSPPCVSPAPAAVSLGALATGESRTYRCVLDPTSQLTTVALVTALPVDPVNRAPFPRPNPRVEDSDLLVLPAAEPPEPPPTPAPRPPRPTEARPPAPAPPPPLPLPLPLPLPVEPAVRLQIFRDSGTTVVEVLATGVTGAGYQLVYRAPAGHSFATLPEGCEAVQQAATCAVAGPSGVLLRFVLRPTGEAIQGSHDVRLVGPDGTVLVTRAVQATQAPDVVAEGGIIPLATLPLIAGVLVVAAGMRGVAVRRHD